MSKCCISLTLSLFLLSFDCFSLFMSLPTGLSLFQHLSHHFLLNSVSFVPSFILCSDLPEGSPSYLLAKLNCHKNVLAFYSVSSFLLGLWRHIWEDRCSLMNHSECVCVWHQITFYFNWHLTNEGRRTSCTLDNIINLYGVWTMRPLWTLHQIVSCSRNLFKTS